MTGACQKAAFCPPGSRTVTWQLYLPGGSLFSERLKRSGAVFNLFTGTIWSKTRYRCSTIVQIMRGIAQAVPTKHLAAELGINRTHLLERRHQIQTLLAARLSPLRPISGRGDRSRRTLPISPRRQRESKGIRPPRTTTTPEGSHIPPSCT